MEHISLCYFGCVFLDVTCAIKEIFKKFSNLQSITVLLGLLLNKSRKIYEQSWTKKRQI